MKPGKYIRSEYIWDFNTSASAHVLAECFREKETEKHTKMGKGKYSNVQHKTFNFGEKI